MAFFAPALGFWFFDIVADGTLLGVGAAATAEGAGAAAAAATEAATTAAFAGVDLLGAEVTGAATGTYTGALTTLGGEIGGLTESGAALGAAEVGGDTFLITAEDAAAWGINPLAGANTAAAAAEATEAAAFAAAEEAAAADFAGSAWGAAEGFALATGGIGAATLAAYSQHHLDEPVLVLEGEDPRDAVEKTVRAYNRHKKKKKKHHHHHHQHVSGPEDKKAPVVHERLNPQTTRTSALVQRRTPVFSTLVGVIVLAGVVYYSSKLRRKA